MAYFLPSFFQKRLLKYALSRLGLVDTEALDPDNLGIRWGQRSTVELRDIGLKLEVSRKRYLGHARGIDRPCHTARTSSTHTPNLSIETSDSSEPSSSMRTAQCPNTVSQDNRPSGYLQQWDYLRGQRRQCASTLLAR